MKAKQDMQTAPSKVQHFIGGSFCASENGAWIERENPATGEPLRLVARGGASEVQRAICAAEKAATPWAATSASERSRVLLRIADGIDAALEALALAESEDTGKPLSLARSLDIPRAAANFRFFATAILHETGESYRTETPQHALNYVLRKPIGIVGCISPWNLPLYLFSWKIAPALAAGNVVIGKPSELAPMTASMLCEIASRAGLPAGVLNVVHGLGGEAGHAIVSHSQTKAISFTGGTATGAAIATVAAPAFKKLSLELGGKNPTIICADADLTVAMPEIVRSAFLNQGQICLCGSRILVHQSRLAEFMAQFTAHVSGLRVGDPLESESDLGSLVSNEHRAKVQALVQSGIDDGAKIVMGGNAPIRLSSRVARGAFMHPTILLAPPQESRCVQEEIFGPVVTVQSFDRHADAVRLANGTRYGLAATIWTRDLSRAHRMASALDAGIVWVNCWLLRDLRTPFGGTKDSGVGREGGTEALRFFTEQTNVCIATGAQR